MPYTIAFSGPAGEGVNTAGLLLAKYLIDQGYTVCCDKQYASVIKGDNNLFIIYLTRGDTPIRITNHLDIYFYFNEYALTKNNHTYTYTHPYKVPKKSTLFQNSIALGMAFRLLGFPHSHGHHLVEQELKHKEQLVDKNYESFDFGYETCIDTPPIITSGAMPSPTTQTHSCVLLTGNDSIAYGAVKSGATFYAAYPMTPASSLINAFLRFPSVTFFQGEDEIAVAMAMLGARYAGKRALCGTSGGGFALMSESISFSHQAELGGVYILAQRAGPSTGTPTYTEQADIDFALHASFGDTKPIVVVPSTIEEAHMMIGRALNRSDIYQHPVIMLTDKQFSESYRSISEHKLSGEPINRGKFLQTPPEDFLRYQNTNDGISPYTIPGYVHGEFIATSYEHTESGATTEDPVDKIQQTNKRATKMNTFIQQEYTETFFGYEIIHPDATKFFISFGANRGVIESYLHDHPERGAILVKVLQPFDRRLAYWLEKNSFQIDRLVFVEMNYSGQFQHLICDTCTLTTPHRSTKISHIRKRSLYPIFLEDIEAHFANEHKAYGQLTGNSE